MFTAAMSLTITPTRIPSLFSRICFSKVVFPEPRKPEISVMGTRLSLSIKAEEASSTEGSRDWVVAAEEAEFHNEVEDKLGGITSPPRKVQDVVREVVCL
jgi:hypothetical protein